MTWLSTETVAPGGLVRTIIRRRTQPLQSSTTRVASNKLWRMYLGATTRRGILKHGRVGCIRNSSVARTKARNPVRLLFSNAAVSGIRVKLALTIDRTRSRHAPGIHPRHRPVSRNRWQSVKRIATYHARPSCHASSRATFHQDSLRPESLAACHA